MTTTSTAARRATWSTSCASSRPPPAWCRRTARSWSSASATRSATGAYACCRLTAAACTRPGAWPCRARIRDRFGLESDAIWSDDGIIVHLPDADEPPGTDLVMVEPDELEDLVVGELGGSALFGARFRENAARSLLIPRAYPGRRTPLWQQRLKAQTLLEVARRYGQFPVVLETYRECLRDVLDLPGLAELLRALHRRELSLVEVETQTASPFASSLLFDYVATYMYEGDTPNAERRAAALSLDRDLLRELLGQEELRELIDPDALDKVEADLQHRSAQTRAGNRDALHDVLRHVGDLTDAQVGERVLEGVDAARHAGRAGARAARDPSARGRRGALDRRLRTPACIATRWPWCPPAGLPDAFLAAEPDPLAPPGAPPRRTPTGPSPPPSFATRYGIDPTAVLRELEKRGQPGARRAAPRWQRARMVRSRGAAPPASRLAGRAAQGDRTRRPARAGRLPALLAGSRPSPGSRGGHRPPAGGAGAAAGPGPARRRLGARHPAPAHRRLLPNLDGPAVRQRGAGLGGRRRAGAPLRTRGALLPRGPGHAGRASVQGRAAERGGARPFAGPPACGRLLLHRPAGGRRAVAGGAAGGAVGPGVGGRDDQRRVRAPARAAPDAGPGPGGRAPTVAAGASPPGAAAPRPRCRGGGR